MQNPQSLSRGFIEACKTCWVLYGRSIEASSRLSKTQVLLCETNRGIHEAFVNCGFLRSTHGGLVETSSSLAKPIGFCICQIHRGFLKAFKNQVLFSQNNRGVVEAFENCWCCYAEPIETSSRLYRGLQNLLIFIWKIHRGFLEAFRNSGFIRRNLSRHRRGFSEVFVFYCVDEYIAIKLPPQRRGLSAAQMC